MEKFRKGFIIAVLFLLCLVVALTTASSLVYAQDVTPSNTLLISVNDENRIAGYISEGKIDFTAVHKDSLIEITLNIDDVSITIGKGFEEKTKEFYLVGYNRDGNIALLNENTSNKINVLLETFLKEKIENNIIVKTLMSSLNLLSSWPNTLPLYFIENENEVKGYLSENAPFEMSRDEFDSQKKSMEPSKNDRLMLTPIICSSIGKVHQGSYLTFIGAFWAISFEETVGGDNCFGRCGKGCIGTTDDSNWIFTDVEKNLLDNNVNRYTQACFNHDGCVTKITGPFHYLYPTCVLTFFLCVADFLNAEDCKPSTPTNLTATAILATQIDLTWNKGEGGNTETSGYDIYRNDEKISSVSDSNTTSYSDTQLTDTAEYCYTVQAYGYATDLFSDKSNEVCASVASAPTTTTNSATNITSNLATLNATVNPNGSSTTAYFEYGTTTSYGKTTSSQSIGSGTNSTSVAANLAGLSSNTTYHYRVVATNSAGTTNGSDISFTTSGSVPTVTINSATSVTSSSATLNASVNPNGSSTTAYFQYGTTTSYGKTTSSQSIGSGTSSQSVTASLSSLSSNTTYHYQVVATNSAGTSYGSDVSFTTTGSSCTYSISSTSQSFSSSGGSGSVSVTTNSGCSWTATSNASWITITSGSSGSGNGTVNYSVSSNSGSSSRSGTMTIAGQTFTVTRSGTSACTYSISPTNQSFDSNGGTGSVSVTASSGCSWTATESLDWVSITSGSSGTGSGTVNYSVSSNSSTSSRSGTMTIAGNTFTLTQSGASTCSYTISPTSKSFSASGGSSTMSVSTSSACSWSAYSDVSWITITSGSSGTGSGTVYYSVSSNSSSSSRTGTISVYGAYSYILTVTQEGASTTQTERITDGSFSYGSSYWPLSGDFWAGNNLTRYYSSPGYAAGGVDSTGSPKNNASGYMYQSVTIPSNATSATLSFYLNITSDEGTTAQYDKLYVEILNSSGSTLATLATYSNQDKGSSCSSTCTYYQKSFSVTSYKGQPIRIRFRATTDSTTDTVFRIDDVSLMSDGN